MVMVYVAFDFCPFYDFGSVYCCSLSLDVFV